MRAYKKARLFISFIFIISFVFGCSFKDKASKAGKTSVTIKTGIQKKDATSSKAAAPTDVASISLTVLGSDMDDISEDIPLETGVLTLDVPAGDERTFSVLAQTESGEYYSGSTQTDLELGVPANVVVDMLLNDVSISSPLDASFASDTQDVEVNVQMHIEVSKVELYVNGLLNSTVETSPYVFSWDTTSGSNGIIALYAIAYDIADNTYTSDSISVGVMNGDAIGVKVTDALLENTNKVPAAEPVELWAVTTMYETPLSETEKSKLTCNDDVCMGIIPLISPSSRTVIVFDDAFTTPHPYQGSVELRGLMTAGYYNSSVGSGGHLLKTDDYFSPCGGGMADGSPIGGDVLYNTLSAVSYASSYYTVYPQRLPFFGVDVTLSTPVGNDKEVYRYYTLVSPGSVIELSYTELSQDFISDFCTSVTLNVVKVGYTATGPSANQGYASYSMAIFFTDTNFHAGGGSPNDNSDRIIYPVTGE